jgi:hypothetical protein
MNTGAVAAIVSNSSITKSKSEAARLSWTQFYPDGSSRKYIISEATSMFQITAIFYDKDPSKEPRHELIAAVPGGVYTAIHGLLFGNIQQEVP